MSSKATVSCLGKQWLDLKRWGQGRGTKHRATSGEPRRYDSPSVQLRELASTGLEGKGLDRLCPALSQDGRAGQAPHRTSCLEETGPVDRQRALYNKVTEQLCVGTK